MHVNDRILPSICPKRLYLSNMVPKDFETVGHKEETKLFIKDFGVEIWLNHRENDCIYNLSETCAVPLTVDELLQISGEKDAVLREIGNITLNYGDITGSYRLKQAISTLYKNVPAERITTAHGAIGANAIALMVLLEPGDHVISVVPTYQQYYSFPESIGAEFTLVRLKEENNWLPDLEEIKAAIRPNTKVICINNPNNPTSAVMDGEMLKAMADIAAESSAYLFCDEAFRGLNYEGDSLGPSAIDIYDKAIVTSSMSKTLSLAGLRMGWIAGPQDIIDTINIHRDYHIISTGKIDELLAAVAIENKDTILERNTAACREKVQFIAEWIEKEPHYSFIRPTTGTTCFIKFDMDITSKELCDRLQHEAGVLFVPGSAFECDDHFRLGFGNDLETLKAGLAAVSDWTKKNF